MQIVIDIPESRYSLLKKQASTPLGREKLDEFAEAVLNGTPLPKGHGRLIDADDLLDNTCLDEIPTIIEADTESEG